MAYHRKKYIKEIGQIISPITTLSYPELQATISAYFCPTTNSTLILENIQTFTINDNITQIRLIN